MVGSVVVVVGAVIVDKTPVLILEVVLCLLEQYRHPFQLMEY